MDRNEQIKKAGEIIAYGCSDELRDALIKDFPELAESEDEKIRKECINAVQIAIADGKNKNRCIAWLEKQKEQKPSEQKIKIPKFRVGDIIISKAREGWEKPDKITGIQSDGYNTEPVDTYGGGFIGFSFEDKYELYEQQPVEWSKNEKQLLDSIVDDYEKASKSFCGYDGKIGLLKAIRNGEYGLPKPEWSEDIRNWKNIAYYVLKEWLGIGQYLDNPALDKIAEELQKMYGSVNPVSIPQWSEEDKRMLEWAIACCQKTIGQLPQAAANWLKSLRPQPKQEWSEEDDEALNMCVDAIPKAWKTKSGKLLTDWFLARITSIKLNN